mgnify:CR=1 FL=1
MCPLQLSHHGISWYSIRGDIFHKTGSKTGFCRQLAIVSGGKIPLNLAISALYSIAEELAHSCKYQGSCFYCYEVA